MTSSRARFGYGSLTVGLFILGCAQAVDSSDGTRPRPTAAAGGGGSGGESGATAGASAADSGGGNPAATAGGAGGQGGASILPGEPCSTSKHVTLGSTGTCYLVRTAPASWQDAEQDCQRLGGHLVSLSSSAQWQELKGTLIQHGWKKLNLWLGLNDLDSEGQFVWSDGSEVEYTPWRPGDGAPNPEQNCAQLLWDVDLWLSSQCDAEHPYLCQGVE